jgi:EmrB/QacA subfamily drug resistance transporter
MASEPTKPAPSPNEPDPTLPALGPGGTKYPAFLLVFPSIMLPMFLSVVDQTIVATALPAIAAATGQVERAPWVVVAYLIAATIAAPLYGRLGDSFGRRRMMFVALPTSMLGALCCAASPTIELLTAARALQGFGGGGLMTLCQALIGEAIPPRERARYQGYLATVAVVANTFGPIVGGYVTEHFGWQAIFLINLPIGLVAILLVLRLPVRTKERIEWHADPGGLVLFTMFVAMTLFSLQQVQRADLSLLPMGASVFTLGMISLVLLIRHENRTPSPLIPLALLRKPPIWRCNGMAACHGAALVSLITFLPIYLRAVRGASPAETGLILLPMTAGIGIGSMITGQLVTRTGQTAIFPTVGLLAATAGLLFVAFLSPHLTTGELPWIFAVIALFMGTVMGVVQVTVQAVAGPRLLGTGAAMVQFSRSVGAAFGTATVAATLFSFLALSDRDAANLFGIIIERGPDAIATLAPARQAVIEGEIGHAFTAAFIAIAAFTGIGAWLAWTLPLRRL